MYNTLFAQQIEYPVKSKIKTKLNIVSFDFGRHKVNSPKRLRFAIIEYLTNGTCLVTMKITIPQNNNIILDCLIKRFLKNVLLYSQYTFCFSYVYTFHRII